LTSVALLTGLVLRWQNQRLTIPLDLWRFHCIGFALRRQREELATREKHIQAGCFYRLHCLFANGFDEIAFVDHPGMSWETMLAPSSMLM